MNTTEKGIFADENDLHGDAEFNYRYRIIHSYDVSVSLFDDVCHHACHHDNLDDVEEASSIFLEDLKTNIDHLCEESSGPN